MPCSPPLVFDSVIGACVLEDQLSLDAKSCSQFGECKHVVFVYISYFVYILQMRMVELP